MSPIPTPIPTPVLPIPVFPIPIPSSLQPWKTMRGCREWVISQVSQAAGPICVWHFGLLASALFQVTP